MAQAFIRCTSKLFHNVSVAVGQDLANFLKISGFNTKETLFQRWVGSKFNILFVSAKVVYLIPKYSAFPFKVSLSNNPVSVSIMNFLKRADYKMDLMCLGVIEVYLTSSWEIIGDDNP